MVQQEIPFIARQPQLEADLVLIIDFSSLGSGTGNQVDLCGTCRYFIKIQYRNQVPTVAWLTGEAIMQQYRDKDVKITVRGLKRCVEHQSSPRETAPEFLKVALQSGIDISERVDRYRYDILKGRQQ